MCVHDRSSPLSTRQCNGGRDMSLIRRRLLPAIHSCRVADHRSPPDQSLASTNASNCEGRRENRDGRRLPVSFSRPFLQPCRIYIVRVFSTRMRISLACGYEIRGLEFPISRAFRGEERSFAQGRTIDRPAVKESVHFLFFYSFFFIHAFLICVFALLLFVRVNTVSLSDCTSVIAREYSRSIDQSTINDYISTDPFARNLLLLLLLLCYTTFFST